MYVDTAHRGTANERVLHSGFIGLSKEEPRIHRLVKVAELARGGIFSQCRNQRSSSRGQLVSPVSLVMQTPVQIAILRPYVLAHADKRLHSVPQAPQEPGILVPAGTSDCISVGPVCSEL